MTNKFQHIIFDLDGTLTDPREGILNSLRFALKKIQIFPLPDQIPSAFIGPPLQKGFREVFGLNDSQTELVVRLFREYYGTRGLYENDPFDNINEMLNELSENGIKLYVATSKLEEYAWKIIRHFEMDRYITDLTGADYNGTHTKAELIEILIAKYRMEKSETLMVGDTLYDIEGARNAGIACLAVGYGFNSTETLLSAKPDFFARDVNSLIELLCE